MPSHLSTHSPHSLKREGKKLLRSKRKSQKSLVSNKIRQRTNKIPKSRKKQPRPSKISLMQLQRKINRHQSKLLERLKKKEQKKPIKKPSNRRLRRLGANPSKKTLIVSHRHSRRIWMRSSQRLRAPHQKYLGISKRCGTKHSLMSRISLLLRWNVGRSRHA